MDRRNFLRSLIGGVAATAAVRTWPFRVFSFPSKIEIAPPFWRIRALELENGRIPYITYKVTRIDQEERIIELEVLRRSRDKWIGGSPYCGG